MNRIHLACPLALLSLSALATETAHAQIWEECNLRDSYLGESPGDSFGWVGLNAGDVDADGVDDLIVGAPGNDGGGAQSGRAYVYSGDTGLLLFTFTGTPGEGVGTDVACAGDVNADGYGDVIVGGPGAGAGSAYVLLGPSGTLFHTLSANLAGDNFGASVSSAGDVNADGYDDVIAAAPQDDTAFNNAGRAYVYSGFDATLIRTHEGQAAGDTFGTSVGFLGDRHPDGFDDYIVGAANAGPGSRGRAYVYSGFDGAEECVLDTDATGVNFGSFFIGWIGDVDDDGGPDFFVADWANSALGPGTGRVFVYRGVDCSLIHTLTGSAQGVGFGIGRGWCGDYDGDGHDDMFFGSWTANDGGNNAGKGEVFSGDDASILGTFHGDQPGANLGFDAAGMGDIDGDGVPDFVLTAASLSNTTGATYTITGAPDLPKNYCEGAPNSAGPGARIQPRRSLSIATNQFRVRVVDAVPNETAVFYYGDERQIFPFGDGFRCVTGNTYRLAPPVTLNASGAKFLDVDFTQPPAGAGSAITAGSTWNFQCWYRDPAGPLGSGFNFSDATRVRFCP